jgi:hypothetical protein
MNVIISLLAIIGLTYVIQQASGPFGIISKTRNALMQNKYVGVFFYQLLSCPFCTGFWSGVAVHCLQASAWEVKETIIWGLTGASTSLIMDAILNRLWKET